MLKTRTYNTKTSQIAGWNTTCKRSQIEVIDSLSGYAVHICLGKNPRIFVFEGSDEHNFGAMVADLKVNAKTGEVTLSK